MCKKENLSKYTTIPRSQNVLKINDTKDKLDINPVSLKVIFKMDTCKNSFGETMANTKLLKFDTSNVFEK